jgi:hypothetical protein
LFRAKDLNAVDRCSQAQHRPGNRRLLVWGDSHAKVYGDALRAAGKKLGWTVTTANLPGCPPLFGVRREEREGVAGRCTERAGARMKAFIARHHFDAILLVARFGLYEKGWMKNGRLARATHFISDAKTRGRDARSSAEVLRRNLLKTTETLAKDSGAAVLVALPTPVMPKAISSRDTKHALHVTRAAYLEGRAFFDEVASQFPPSVGLIDPVDALCDSAICSAWGAQGPLYKDDNHLRPAGAKRLVPLVRKALDAKFSPRARK